MKPAYYHLEISQRQRDQYVKALYAAHEAFEVAIALSADFKRFGDADDLEAMANQLDELRYLIERTHPQNGYPQEEQAEPAALIEAEPMPIEQCWKCHQSYAYHPGEQNICPHCGAEDVPF